MAFLPEGYLNGVPDKHLLPGLVKKRITLNFISHKEYDVSKTGDSCNPVILVLRSGDWYYFPSFNLEKIKKYLGIKYLLIEYWCPLPSKYKDSAIHKKKTAMPVEKDDIFELLKEALKQ
jgi:hypothetical protein